MFDRTKWNRVHAVLTTSHYVDVRENVTSVTSGELGSVTAQRVNELRDGLLKQKVVGGSSCASPLPLYSSSKALYFNRARTKSAGLLS